MISDDLINEIEHVLTSITGLYACDNDEGENLFRLNFAELLNKIEKEKQNNKEKYPQLILGTDNVFEIRPSEGTEITFKSQESLEEFIKNNEFTIKCINISPMHDRKDTTLLKLAKLRHHV